MNNRRQRFDLYRQRLRNMMVNLKKKTTTILPGSMQSRNCTQSLLCISQCWKSLLFSQKPASKQTIPSFFRNVWISCEKSSHFFPIVPCSRFRTTVKYFLLLFWLNVKKYAENIVSLLRNTTSTNAPFFGFETTSVETRLERRCNLHLLAASCGTPQLETSLSSSKQKTDLFSCFSA